MVWQKGRKVKIEATKKITSTATFQEKSQPNICLSSGRPKPNSNPPSRVPTGHMNLQKYGLPRPAGSSRSNGKARVNTRITNLSFFNTSGMAAFLFDNRPSSSCTKPKGQSHPQMSLPVIAPTIVRSPAM